MLNFKNLSPPRADFYSKLDTLNKNILYVTHQVDKILKLQTSMVIDNDLQNTVDKYFDESQDLGADDMRTSPQTEQKTHEEI